MTPDQLRRLRGLEYAWLVGTLKDRRATEKRCAYQLAALLDQFEREAAALPDSEKKEPK